MTTLYREVKIETDEQARALPWGTIAFDASRINGPVQKEDEDYWFGGHSKDDEDVAYFGYTALVPIEAEEETTRLLHLDGRMDGYSFEAGDELPEEFFSGPPRSRYVTEWTEKGE